MDHVLTPPDQPRRWVLTPPHLMDEETEVPRAEAAAQVPQALRATHTVGTRAPLMRSPPTPRFPRRLCCAGRETVLSTRPRSLWTSEAS